MPAGPEAAAGALITLAGVLDRVYNRIADWAEGQPMAPATAAGISLILGICAAAWFTAGTQNGDFYGAIVLAVGYLVTLGSREFLDPGPDLAAGSAAGRATGDSTAGTSTAGTSTAGLVAGTRAARAAWLGRLGTRLSEYAIYVGLAVGAAAEGWHGVWPLTIAVLGLAAVCDTMAVCSRRPAWPAARPGHSGVVSRIPPGIEPDDTIPDVPAWEGTAPDAAWPDGSVSLGRSTGRPAHDGLPRAGLTVPDPGHGGAEPDQPGLASLAGRVLLTALSMPPGARVLLVIVAAPIFGSQPALLGLLDWGIIAVGFGIGSRSAVRRRDRKAADHRAHGSLDRPVRRDEPGSPAILLLPARPDEDADEAADVPPAPQFLPGPQSALGPQPGLDPQPAPDPQLALDPQIPVVRIAPSPSGTAPEPAESLRGGGPADETDYERAAYASELSNAAAFDSAAFAGDPSVGAAFGLSYVGEAATAPADAGPARHVPGRSRGGRPRGGSHQPHGGRGLGRLFAGRGSRPARGGRVPSPAGDAVYDWADDNWADGTTAGSTPAVADGGAAASATASSGGPTASSGGPTGGTDGAAGSDFAPAAAGSESVPAPMAGTAGTSPGPVTDAELADQDAWDAELAAGESLGPDYPGAEAFSGLDERPTLAERLGLGRPVDADGSLDPDGEPGWEADDGYAAQADTPGATRGHAGPHDPKMPEYRDDAGDPDDAAVRRNQATVLRNRDDGTLSHWFGQLVRGQLMPLPPALLALAAVAMLAHLGLRDLPGLLILAPALVMLVAAPGASHRHDGRFDWLVPGVLQGAQYVYIGALGFAAGVPAPITFLLCVTVALHYADLGSPGSPILLSARRAAAPPAARGRAPGRPARPRRSLQQRLGHQRPAPAQPPAGRAAAAGQQGQRPPATELGTWMGWEGRMIAVGLGAAMGVAMFAYLALAGYLSYLICCKVRASYLGLREGGVR